MNINRYNIVSKILSENNLYYTEKDFNTNDSELFSSRLSVAASKQNLIVHNLGFVKDFPLLLLTPTQFISAPNILIAAGFHGDEPAPCWALLRILEKSQTLLKTCNVSFLPCVNSTGFKESKRNNMFNENPNRGFAYYFDKPMAKSDTIISAEGKLLLQHMNLIKDLSRDAFLTMHEDDTKDKFYLYSTRAKRTSQELENKMLKDGVETFGTFEKEVIEKNSKKQEANIVNGIARNIQDGSFEDFLFRKIGIPYCFVTETPTKKDFYKRVWVNMKLIKTFIQHFGVVEK